jgi:hypothetical protein
VSPTMSGIRLLPMMGGLLVASIVTGQLVSKGWKYRPFPIFGTAIMTIGLGLLGTLGVSTPSWTMSFYILILGAGIGLVMQVLVTAVQNAVDPADLGAATAGANFFRSIGGSFGTAVFGALYVNVLPHQLATGIASHTYTGKLLSPSLWNASTLKTLPLAELSIILHAIAGTIQSVYRWALPFGVLAVVLSNFVRICTTSLTTFQCQTPNTSNNQCKTVVEGDVIAVVGIGKVEIESWFEEIAHQYDLNGIVAHALCHFVNVLTSHHDHNVLIVEVRAVSECAERSRHVKSGPIQGAPSSVIHWLTHVPICGPGASHVNSTYELRILAHELATHHLGHRGPADVASTNHGHPQRRMRQVARPRHCPFLVGARPLLTYECIGGVVTMGFKICRRETRCHFQSTSSESLPSLKSHSPSKIPDSQRMSARPTCTPMGVDACDGASRDSSRDC